MHVDLNLNFNTSAEDAHVCKFKEASGQPSYPPPVEDVFKGSMAQGRHKVLFTHYLMTSLPQSLGN